MHHPHQNASNGSPIRNNLWDVCLCACVCAKQYHISASGDFIRSSRTTATSTTTNIFDLADVLCTAKWCEKRNETTTFHRGETRCVASMRVLVHIFYIYVCLAYLGFRRFGAFEWLAMPIVSDRRCCERFRIRRGKMISAQRGRKRVV